MIFNHFSLYQSLILFWLTNFWSTSGYDNMCGSILFLLLTNYSDECQKESFGSYQDLLYFWFSSPSSRLMLKYFNLICFFYSKCRWQECNNKCLEDIWGEDMSEIHPTYYWIKLDKVRKERWVRKHLFYDCFHSATLQKQIAPSLLCLLNKSLLVLMIMITSLQWIKIML